MLGKMFSDSQSGHLLQKNITWKIALLTITKKADWAVSQKKR